MEEVNRHRVALLRASCDTDMIISHSAAFVKKFLGRHICMDEKQAPQKNVSVGRKNLSQGIDKIAKQVYNNNVGAPVTVDFLIG